jgi:hypothetical protein
MKQLLQPRRATELRLQARENRDETRSEEAMQYERRTNVLEDHVEVAVSSPA